MLLKIIYFVLINVFEKPYFCFILSYFCLYKSNTKLNSFSLWNMLFGILLIHVGLYFKRKLFYSLWGEICILYQNGYSYIIFHYLCIDACSKINYSASAFAFYDSCNSLRFTAIFLLEWPEEIWWCDQRVYSTLKYSEESLL